MESRPDFSGIFWPGYLDISSKIQTRIFPEKTIESDYAVWYHGTEDYEALGAQNRMTNLISF